MKLGFIVEGGLVKKIQLLKGKILEIRIGKSDDNDIIIKNNVISKYHAQLIYDQEGDLYIIDLSSTNGTFVNGQKIVSSTPIKINKTDKITLSKGEGVMIVFNPDDYSSRKSEIKDFGNVDTGSSSTIIEKLKKKKQIIVGRNPNCDVLINNPSVSRQHAVIERVSQSEYSIKDLGSLNGTFVNGRRISGATRVTNQDVILIGRFRISLSEAPRDLSREAAIKAERIIKKYSNGYIGLHETTIEIPSKALLAVMGPSGCGKSTLLKALNGDSPASSGRVTICGLELNENYDYIKTHIGYVPQDDIVHRELSVYKSLYYAAKLRLCDATESEIESKINEVLHALNITHLKNNMVSEISGGQRKRVSIAVEILTDPLVLFLDEPTSPLDPQTIKEFLGCLRELAKKGTTVIMVTHKPEDLHHMDSVIFMAEGGHLVYYGDSKSYLSYFGHDYITSVYEDLVKEKAGRWISKYKSSNPEKKIASLPPAKIKSTAKINYFHQYFWLTKRYFNIKLNDKINSFFMIGQAPIIAILICMIYDHIELAVPFLIAVSAVWFGANNAAREIVGEFPIYKRERMFNQSILSYIFSKITVLGAFALVQAVIFISILTLKFSGTKEVVWTDPLASVLWMVFLSVAATLMGLLLSAIVDTTEKVMTLVPITLIPQILLAGVLSKLPSSIVELMSYVTISRWGTEGFTNIQQKVEVPKHSIFDQNNKVVDSLYMEDYVKESCESKARGEDVSELEMSVEIEKSNGVELYNDSNAVDFLNNQYHSSYKEFFPDLYSTFTIDFIAVLIISIVFFIGIYITLKRKDSIKIG
jgi:ABC-type multidrug transport system ATPase subunit/pSer/pThr/pTyr-binding forkhead associated (FHA) protein